MQAPLDWEYTAGFLDGEGTVGVWTYPEKRKVVNRLAWYNTHLDTLERIHALLGTGELRPRSSKSTRPGYRQQYQVTISNRIGLLAVLPQMIPYMIEKRQAAEDMFALISPLHYAAFRHHIPTWSMGWSYLAAFMDGEGSIAIPTATARQQKGNVVCWHNSYLPTLERIQAFLGYGAISSRQHSGFNGKKTGHTLAINTQADKIAALEGMLPYLIQKREKALAMLERLRMQILEPRGRNRGALLTIPADELRRLYHEEGVSMGGIAERYSASISGIQRLMRLYAIERRPAGGAHFKGQKRPAETIARMKEVHRQMWEDPAFAAGQVAHMQEGKRRVGLLPPRPAAQLDLMTGLDTDPA